MSLKKWLLIHRNLSFDVDFIEDLINQSFQRHWTPFPHVAVDEGMIPFKGRFRYRQHIKGKPKATGIKFYALTDETGYVWAFWTYSGYQPKTVEIVTGFTEHLPNRPYFVYCDSYYGSLKLALKLAKQGHKFTFTTQANRPSWLFAGFLLRKLKKNEWKSAYLHHKGLTALSFYDNGKCNFFSNLYTGEDSVLTIKNRRIPALVADYRRWYGAVDTSDSNHLRYLFPHKNQKRTMAQLISYIKMCVSNSWILYQHLTGQTITQRAFVRKLIDQLSPEPEEIGVPSKAHMITKTDHRGSCSYCSATKKIRSSTPFKCNTCNKFLHSKCFKEFHSQ